MLRPSFWPLFCALLSGCASIPGDIADTPEKVHWQFSGKLSVRTGGQTQVMSVAWVQGAQRSEITLTGPLGLKSVQIVVDKGQITIDDGSDVSRYTTEMALQVGKDKFHLPWASIAYWVRGLRGPGLEAIGKSGYESGPWRVHILRSDSMGPQLIEFEHEEVQLRLKIRKWQFEE